MSCSLCGSQKLSPIPHKFVKNRRFLHCQNCDLIFVPEIDQSSVELEKKRYEAHQNSSQEDGYEKFLMQAVQPVLDEIPVDLRRQLKTLDYGCGPEARLSKILVQYGFNTTNFDIYFQNDLTIFDQKWDLIFSTEVWEHFRNPKNEIEKLYNLLSSKGKLVIMTQLHNIKNFFDWWYPRDFTHVAFYSKNTMQHISKVLSLDCKIIESTAIIFLNLKKGEL